jgi:hypothetical protein
MAKSQIKFNKHHQPIVKTEVVLKNETHDKIEAIRKRLHEIRMYKRLIAQDGLEPDQEDKRLESELIVRLLRLEKSLTPAPRPKKPAAATEAKAGRRQRVGRRQRGS